MRIKYFFMDKRLKKINQLLGAYSIGRFDKKLALSEKLDATDAVVNGINMLGEELKAITISRDYFTNIFNSVSDMVFILNRRGIIENVNRSGEQQLGYEPLALTGKAFNILHKSSLSFFHSIRKGINKQKALLINDSYLESRQGGFVHVRINAAPFYEGRRKLILLTASDTSFQVKAEKMIIRAIIDTQEKERQRLAKDLHDGLTQQLSAIKFYISSLTQRLVRKEDKAILMKSREGLTSVIKDMRSICFNLMPRTLEEFGLIKAVREFCDHFPQATITNFVIYQKGNLDQLASELIIDLYRVVQEIVANAILHGKAESMELSFVCSKRELSINIADNGNGFDTGLVNQGMGLKNIESRVRSHNGKLYLHSKPGEGALCKIIIPLNKDSNK